MLHLTCLDAYLSGLWAVDPLDAAGELWEAFDFLQVGGVAAVEGPKISDGSFGVENLDFVLGAIAGLSGGADVVKWGGGGVAAIVVALGLGEAGLGF